MHSICKTKVIFILHNKGNKGARKGKSLLVCGLCMVKKVIVKRRSEDLVPKTLNYQDWKLEVLPSNGGVGGALLNALLLGVECSCLWCRMADVTLISFRLLSASLQCLACRVWIHQITLR